MTETFCILPWIHMHIWPDGKVFPCCMAEYNYRLGNTNDNNFNEIWNSHNMRSLRLDMLSNRKSIACSKCYETESVGGCSMRNNMNRDYSHLLHLVENTHSDGSVDQIHMAYMDIRFSNICNFKCRTCSPGLSSSWYDEYIQLDGVDKPDKKFVKITESFDNIWDDMLTWIDTVENIYFAGGEPLIMDEHYKILEHLIDIGKTNIQLFYNTNLSKLNYKNKNVLELWKHFKHVRIDASLDASHSRAELIRSGTNWEQIEKNIELIKTQPNIQFYISSTISILNVLTCLDFFSYCVAKKWVSYENLMINILMVPEYFRIQILPDDVKISLKNDILKHISENNISNNSVYYNNLMTIYNSLDINVPNLSEKFMLFNNHIDILRNENIFHTLPELKVLNKDD